jgi:hypothetical protein
MEFLTRTALTFVAAAALLPAVDPALLNLVGKDPKMAAGMDVERARNSVFGQKVLGEFKDEDSDFRKFIDMTGFDPRRDLREVFMVSDSAANRMESTLILARGSFNVARIQAALRQEGKTSSLYKGVEIWTSPQDNAKNNAMALLSGSVAVFGEAALVRGAVDRMNQSSTGLSAAMRGRINDWSSKNDAWFVSPTALSDLGVGKPGSNNQVMPQNGFSTDAIKEASAGVKFGSELFISGETLARSEKDAQALADVLRFFASMVRLNAKPGMEAALRIADSLKIEVVGATTKFSLSVPEEEWNKLIDGKPGRTAAQAKNRDAI